MTNRTLGNATLVIGLSVSLACLACAGGEGGSGTAPVSVRDSAGVEIVTVAHPAWSTGEGWTVGSQPSLEIGAVEGEDAYQLYRVFGAIRLGDGAIVVANGGTQQLRWFDAAGKFIRNAGGKGEGPGEFNQLFSLARTGDTLIAHDYRLARLTRFDTAGTFLGTVQLARDPGLPITVWPAGTGYIGMIPEIAYDVTQNQTYHRRNSTYVRYAADGTLLDTIAVLPGPEMLVRGGPVSGGFTMSMTTPIIGHTSQQAVVGSQLVAGVTDRFEIRVYAPDGTLQRLIRDPSRNLPVTQAEWNAALAEEMANAKTPEERKAVQEVAKLRPAPETRPAFDRFVADRLGYLWVAPYRPTHGQPTPWLVIDITGKILGTVDLPEGFRPTDIGEDYVLGVIRDDLDVERVRSYRLSRGSG